MIHRSTCVSLYFIFCITILSSISRGDDYSEWSASRGILLNTTAFGAPIAGNVLNIPVLIRLNPGTFAYFSQTSDGGADIRFAKSNGDHLPYQIERWVDNPGNNDTAAIWVKIDTVYANRADQAIVMYWGNSQAADSSDGAAVFSPANGFVGVWHLEESPSGMAGTLHDASANALHGSSVGGMNATRLTRGMIGSAHSFDGVDDADSIPFNPALNIADAITLSAWVNVEAFQEYSRIITRGMPRDTLPWTIYSLNTQDSISAFRGEISTADTLMQRSVIGKPDLQIDTWYHVALTYDRTSMKLYRNGVQDSTGVNETFALGITQTTPLMIGKSNYTSNPFRGIIDEVRVSNVARDSNWIQLCHANQRPGQGLMPVISVLTWDTEPTPGIQAGNGTWGTDRYWSTNGMQLLPWLGRGTNAVFTGGSGSSTVTVNGKQFVDSIAVVSGNYSFSDGTLDFGAASGIFIAETSSVTISSEIAGFNGLVKYGTGTLQLDGNCSYTGPTTVSTGTLLVNGSLDSGSALTAAPGTVVGGSGTIAGDVSVRGAILAPGGSGPGTLLLGSLVLDSTSTLSFQLGTTSDSIGIAGALTLDGTFNLTAGAGFSPGTYRIITYGGLLQNNTLAIGTSPAGRKCTFEFGTGYIDVVISSRILQTEPIDLTVVAGDEATFTASAEGSGSISYRWEQFPGDSVGTGTSFSISSTTLDDNGSRYRCIARDSFASDTSRWAVLTVVDSLRILSQTEDTTVTYGNRAILTFTLADSTLCRYHWYKVDTPEDVYIGSLRTLTIDSVSADDEGAYYCRINNTVATIHTDTIRLTTLPPPPVAGFSATPVSGTFPLSVQFTDTSSGIITSRIWRFGDGTDDDTAANPVHIYETAGLYTVTLKIVGPGGTDSTEKKDLIWVFAEGQNPLRITAEYLRDSTVSVLISGINQIDTTQPQLLYDSIGLWVSPNVLPQSSAEATLLKTWERAAIPGGSFTDQFTLPATDSVYGLMTSVFWNDGSISEFHPANGTVVLMYDTLPINIALQNALRLTQLWYDSLTSGILVSMCITPEYFRENLEIGIAYSTVAPPLEMNGTQVIKMLSTCIDSMPITLQEQEPLQFNTTYYIALFVRQGESEWPAPTDTARGSVTTGAPFRQVVTFFDTAADTVTAFNGRVVLWKDSTVSGYPITTDTIQSYPYTPPDGFTLVGIPFIFVIADRPLPFYVGIRVPDLPAGATIGDVHFYHDSAGIITVDYMSRIDIEAKMVYLRTDNLSRPFIAMVDQLPPQVTLLGNTGALAYPGEDIVDSVEISDNISNVQWSYHYSRGDKLPDKHNSGTLNGTSAIQRLEIPGSAQVISAEYGIRSLLVVCDGSTCDTLNLSRPVFREHSDRRTTTGHTWQPVYATATLDDTDPATVLIPQLSKKQQYDTRLMRLYRWYQTPATVTQDDKWLEYNPDDDSSATRFALEPGRLLWLKTWKDKPINLGNARTLPLNDTFTLTLPAKQFTDFGMPYRFGVYVKDIITAGAPATNNIQMYVWSRDPVSNLYTLNLLYQNTIPENNDSMTILSYSSTGGYSLYNPNNVPVTLRIPPTPAQQQGTAKKAAPTATGQTWCARFSAATSEGTNLPALYCGYAPGIRKSMFPVTPTFHPVRIVVFDRGTGKSEGHYMHEDAAKGVIKEILISNTSDTTAHLNYTLSSLGAFPETFSSRLFNETTQAFSTGGTIEVPAKASVSRWIVAGDAGYFTDFLATVGSLDFGLTRIYPNPARTLVNFRYTVRFGSRHRVVLTIFDLQGRKVWEKHVSSLLSAGEHVITWNGKDLNKSVVGAGRYPVRLSIIDEKGSTVQRFERVITFIP